MGRGETRASQVWAGLGVEPRRPPTWGLEPFGSVFGGVEGCQILIGAGARVRQDELGQCQFTGL